MCNHEDGPSGKSRSVHGSPGMWPWSPPPLLQSSFFSQELGVRPPEDTPLILFCLLLLPPGPRLIRPPLSCSQHNIICIGSTERHTESPEPRAQSKPWLAAVAKRQRCPAGIWREAFLCTGAGWRGKARTHLVINFSSTSSCLREKGTCL